MPLQLASAGRLNGAGMSSGPVPSMRVNQCMHLHATLCGGGLACRGTPEAPGRTVTLHPTGDAVTWGCAFQLAGSYAEQEETLKYLEWREKQYDERAEVDVWGPHPSSGKEAVLVEGALTYIATSDKMRNANYLGPAPLEDIAKQVRCRGVQSLCVGKHTPYEPVFSGRLHQLCKACAPVLSACGCVRASMVHGARISAGAAAACMRLARALPGLLACADCDKQWPVRAQLRVPVQAGGVHAGDARDGHGALPAGGAREAAAAGRRCMMRQALIEWKGQAWISDMAHCASVWRRAAGHGIGPAS